MKISKSLKIKGLIVFFALLLTFTPVGSFLYKTAFGYVGAQPPTNVSIVINNGDSATSSTSVNLTLGATGAAQMIICNDSNFIGCSWETFNTSKSWILTSGDGIKTVYAMYKSSSNDTSAAVSAVITLSTPTSGGGGGGGVAPAPAPTTTTTTPTPAPATTATTPTPAPAPAATGVVTTPADVNSILNTLNLTRDTAGEKKYSPLVASDLKAFGVTGTTEQKTALTNFVVYGISNTTQKLGAGERRALTRDYLETIGRSDVVWSDIEKMATGQKPVARNLAKEQAQAARVLATFKTLVGHAPNFKNAKEDLAWNTMMYRLRFTRDVAKEQAAIQAFKKTFGKAPTTPLAWATVRASAYALK